MCTPTASAFVASSNYCLSVGELHMWLPNYLYISPSMCDMNNDLIIDSYNSANTNQWGLEHAVTHKCGLRWLYIWGLLLNELEVGGKIPLSVSRCCELQKCYPQPPDEFADRCPVGVSQQGNNSLKSR